MRIGDIEYEPTIGNMNIHVDNKPLRDTLIWSLYESNVPASNPFDKDSRQIIFVHKVEEICFKVFDAIKQIKINNGKELEAAYIASYLYESCTHYWMHLLSSGRDVLGIQLWKNILSITDKWETSNKPIAIHRGTAHFFLAENYLLVGDRDLGFQYLYNGLLDDMKLGPNASSLNYPISSPSYLTITMRANINNHLYPLVEKLRTHLDLYVSAYNQEYSGNFSISDFDNRFLDNIDLKDIVSFFVFNFMYLFESKKYGFKIDTLNEMMKLRNLDLIFNFCLIIDKTLELAEKNHGGSTGDAHYFSNGITWISQYRSWMNQTDLQELWGSSNLDLKNRNPDDVIPRLLLKHECFQGKPIQRELHDFLVAYKFRNYGGHNITQQNCLTDKFDDIIQSLFNSLFMAIEELT